MPPFGWLWSLGLVGIGGGGCEGLIRTAMYDVTVQDAEGHHQSGRAYVGGPWTGPVWSSQIELKLLDMTPADD